MAKIQNLFDAYKAQFDGTKNAEGIFSESGMVNRYKELTYGFFPLGSGILTNESKLEKAEIKEGGVMALGHDFGTIKYINEKCKDARENNSKTINHLMNAGLNLENTFFTNFYLGLRDTNKHPEWTMTNMAVSRGEKYREYCFQFFRTQLEIINPSIILCLGKEVGFALHASLNLTFPEFSKRSMVLSKLYDNPANKKYKINSRGTILGDRDFVFVPHPSYAHINWTKNDIKGKIKAEIS